MDKKPLVNILTRTSGRPKYFKRCIESIKNQTYSNINHIVSVDDDKTEEYVKNLTKNYIRVSKYDGNIPFVDPVTKIRRAAPYNLYLNNFQIVIKIPLDEKEISQPKIKIEKFSLVNDIYLTSYQGEL